MMGLLTFCLLVIISCVSADKETLLQLAKVHEKSEVSSSVVSIVQSFNLKGSYETLMAHFSSASSVCFCTTVPCPAVGYNYLSIGGKSMVSRYTSNANSNILVAEASYTVTSATFGSGSEPTSCTRAYARNYDDDGTKDCDAGHIFADRLGGPGNQPLNIFPQNLSVNRGAYAQYEASIYDCFDQSGATSADLYWSFIYDTTKNTMPSSILYTADYTGGSCKSSSQTFTNA